MTKGTHRKTMRPLRKFVLLAISLLPLGSCGTALDPPAPDLDQMCHAPRVKANQPTMIDHCPDNASYACIDPGDLADMGLYVRAQNRTIDRLETCPWVVWY